MIILGIDPGQTGAIVVMRTDPLHLDGIDNKEWCEVGSPDQHAKHLSSIFKRSSIPDVIVVEEQHARATYDANGKRKQGIASTWTYAEHYGILLGCLVAFDRPIYTVDPGVWKGSMGLDRDKNKSLALARKTWPQYAATLFKRKLDHGRAEAALLAEYGKRFLPLEPVKKRREL